MATSFTVNKADLQFILRQIKIAEASSAAYNSAPMTIVQAIQAEYGLAPANAAQSPFGLRTTDGSMNSTVPNQEFFGGADNRFPRLTDPVFRNETDGDSIDLNGRADGGVLSQGNYGQNGHVVDADPRVISNLIVDMSVTNPAAIDAFLHNPLAVAAFEEKHGFAPTEAWLTDPAHVSAANTALQTIPNQSPDLGLTASFNSWMTFFGQFFDHGLDFVVKGGNGSVLIPLMPDDPLITLGPDGQAGTPDELTIPALQFMALTRAKTANGVVDGETLNTTTSFVDQNQTYTSHASHQAFLREYVKDANGHAVSTGNLLDGGHNPALGNKVGAIGNWAEVKAQAKEMLGLILTDHDVLNVPLLLTDQYGRFIPGAGGFAQVVTAVHANGTPTAWVEGTATGLSLPVNTIRTGHAFLDDIAHHAAPGFVDADHNGTMDAGEALQTPDSDPGTGDDRNPATYDDELLNAHFITGDGRGNENIALTTVHAIFHAEHNRLVGSNKATILASGDVAFLNQWLLTDQPGNLTAAQVQALNPADLVWDGERLFQAAKFGTEMQYQHLVFEEFARRIQPMVDPFVFNTSPDVDPSVLAEFAHTVYRFGHSMLTGTVDRLENDLTGVNEVIANVEKTDPDQKVLLAVFLNPAAYLASGADMATVNANLVRGLSRDVGNEIDEFVVNTLRTNLLGLPLDLAALNLARGREVGIPSLNDTRAQLYEDTGLTDLKPYTSWADFAEYLKNPMSIVNFIAAYGTHPLIETAPTLAGKRALAEELVFGVEADGTTRSDIQDRIAFLNATGDYAGGKLGGLNDVDLWIGGLAEAKPEFGGMLGTTFNYVFEYQMEALQNGDRFYYLTRTQGTNFLNQLEPNSFADLVMRNTALGDKYATHLSGQLFVTPDLFLEQDVGIAQTDYNPDEDGRTRASEDPTWADHEAHPLTRPHKVERFGGTTITENGVDHTVGGTFKFYGPEHVVMGGTEGNDLIYSDRGDDTLWGDAGNDYLNGGTGPDDVFGGDGDDIIEDPFGDDVLRGQNGNDVISDSRGANLLFGDAGQDYVIVGQDATEVFAGTGTDFVLGGNGKDFLLGNEGDDWMEGGGGFDTLAGDNSELFFNSPLVGHDVLFGHGDETDYDAESGDDIMGSGPSVYRYEGMFGFDWGIAKFDPSEIHFDLQIPIFTNAEENVLRDRFDQVEGVSGWSGDDRLDGDDRGHSGGSSSPDSVPVELFTDHTLTQEGMDRIAGLQQLLGGAAVTSFKNGNILLGGDGNDTIRGRGGFDTIDGDAWLNVRIKIVHNGATYAAESLTTDTVVAGPNAGRVFNINPDGSPNFNSVAFEGRSLNSLVLDRTINPGDMSIVREILYDNTNVTGAAKNIDTAMFQGGSLEYDIEGTRIVYDAVTGEALRRVNIGQPGNSAEALNIRDVDGDGFIRVKDLDDGLVAAPGRVGGLTVSRGALTDDVDLLKNMERLQFADTAFNVGGTTNRIATGTVTISDPTPYDFDNNPATPAVVSPIVGQVLTATLSKLQDLDGVPINPATGMPVGLTFDWETTEAGNDGGWAKISSGLTYTVRPVDPAHVLRAVAVFKDSAGVTERIASIQTDNVTAPFSVLEGTRTGTVVAPVPFSLDYDPLGFGGTGVTDGDVVQLTHVIQPGQDAGGRFTIVNTGTATAPVYQLAVANGALLDYEAVQVPVDNQYQIVIDTYTDTIANGGTLMASRQFTILLAAAAAPLPGATNGADTLTGTDGNDVLVGLLGADTIIAQGGDDTIVWNAGGGGAGDGRDVVNGGTEGAVGDTFVVNGNGSAETYSIYTRTAALAQIPGALLGTLNPATEIVIRRQTTGGTDVIVAELSEIEEIRINGVDPAGSTGSAGGAGSDTFNIVGDFTGTSLRLNTITIDGDAGDDTVDISALRSAHRIVFRSNGGNDTIVGTLRAQDVIELPAGAAAGDYQTTTVDGVTRMTGPGGHTITYTAASGSSPVVHEDGDGEEEEHGHCEEASGEDRPGAGTGNASVGVTRTGTAGPDVLTGTAGADNLIAFAGDDVLVGDDAADAMLGGDGDDFIDAGRGRDVVTAGSGNDHVFAGAGSDVVYGDDGNDRIFGGDGDDLLTAGAGDDQVFGGAGNDIFAATAGDGNDTYFGDESDGGTGIDTLDMSAITTSLVVNLGAGPLLNGTVTGAGTDTIWGIENVNTGSGADTIIASTVSNILNGGGGADVFRFTSAAAARGDTIRGFEPGDVIDLSQIDSNTGAAGDQGFTLVTNASFSATGQLAVTFGSSDQGDFTLVQGNTDADLDAEFTFRIEGHHNLDAQNVTL